MNLSLMNLVGISVAQVLAGAFGMAFGEYMSNKAERQIALREKNREAWEVENFPEGGMGMGSVASWWDGYVGIEIYTRQSQTQCFGK